MRKVLAIVFGLLFVLFAAFQYNDPDPQVWVPIYGLAAIASFMAYSGAGRPWFYALMTLIYLGAAVYWWPPRFEGFMFSEVGMRSVNIEMAREAGGLAICGAVMIVFGVLSRRAASGRR